MGIQDKIRAYFHRPIDRRTFLSRQLSAMIAGAVLPWPLAKLARVQIVEASEIGTGKFFLAKKGGLQKQAAPIHPMAKPFIGEKFRYNVTLMGMINAAEGKVYFAQDGKGYKGTIEAKATGVAKLVYKEQMFFSHMAVETVNGKLRFLTKIHSRTTTKGDETKRSTHRFDYVRKKWYYQRYLNDKLVKKRTYNSRMTSGKIYDDFVSFFYNFRAKVYGPVEFGKKYTITTIPFKKVDTYTIEVASKEQMKEEKKWIEKFPDTSFMVILKINQKIFGMKTGEAKLIGDKNLKPLSGYVKDAAVFGDVYANIK